MSFSCSHYPLTDCNLPFTFTADLHSSPFSLLCCSHLPLALSRSATPLLHSTKAVTRLRLHGGVTLQDLCTREKPLPLFGRILGLVLVDKGELANRAKLCDVISVQPADVLVSTAATTFHGRRLFFIALSWFPPRFTILPTCCSLDK